MLIAVAGLAGAGKTTAVRYLEERGVGCVEYVGRYLQDAVKGRNLPVTPENECKVRAELRAERGMAAMAELALPDLVEKLRHGPILIDAIYNDEERACYFNAFGTKLIVVGITASREIRANRLAVRPERPITLAELENRDKYELSTLRLEDVVAAAEHKLRGLGDQGQTQGGRLG